MSKAPAAALAPIVLPEHDMLKLPPASLPSQLAERIWQEHASKVSVEFPSPKTGGEWQLVNRGWAGLIPIGTVSHGTAKRFIDRSETRSIVGAGTGKAA